MKRSFVSKQKSGRKCIRTNRKSGNRGNSSPSWGQKNIYNYRNKLEFTFSSKAWLTKEQIGTKEAIDQRVAGFHVPRIFDKILNIETCHLQLPIVNDIRNEVVRFSRENGISFHNIKEHIGFLRNIVFRTSLHSGEIMVTLIVHEDDPSAIDQIFKHLSKMFPAITHLNWIQNSKRNSAFSELPFHIWKGKTIYHRGIGGLPFSDQAHFFFSNKPCSGQKAVRSR